jgi:hypothetical protein
MSKDSATINKEIAAIKTAGAKLDDRIQACAVDVLEHFAEHKDTGMVNRLYLALSKGARSSAMASWLLAYCAVKPNTDPSTKKEQPFAFDREKQTNVEGGRLDMWYTHKPEKAVDEIFDLQKAFRALMAKAAKATNVVHGDRETLKAMAKAVGIPESDVPPVHSAKERADMQEALL